MRANAVASVSRAGVSALIPAFALLGMLSVGAAIAAPKPATSVIAPPAIPDTEEARTLYALGLVLGRNLTSFGLTPAEFATVKAGLDAAVSGAKPAVDLTVYGPKLQAFQAARAHAVAEREEASGAAYLENAAKAPGAIRTPSGAVYQVLKPGDGPSPTPTDPVKVQYEGRLIDGTVFDSSKARGEAAKLVLSKVIACWSEAVPLMKVGGSSRIVCPAKLAYGDRGSGPVIRPGATLVFDIDLIAIGP